MASMFDKLPSAKRAAPKRQRPVPTAPARPTPAPSAPARRRVAPPAARATTGSKGRDTLRRPAPQRVDPEYAALRREIEAAKRGGALTRAPEGPKVQGAGFSPEQLDIFRARGLGDGSGRSLGGFIQNLASGGLDIVTSVPAQAQLVTEAGLYPVVAGYNALTGNRGNRGAGSNLAAGLETRLESDLRAAGSAVKADYAYRYGPLAEGNVGEFGARFYEDPLPTILDVAGGKAVLGRSPNVVRRATRAVAPNTRAGQRAGRSLSTLSAAEREAFAGVTGQRIMPGDGGRYRPPRIVTSRVARDQEGGPVVGERTIQVERRAYSGDAIARARQKGVDKLRNTVGARLEDRANRLQRPATPAGVRQPPLRERAQARVLRPLTTQARFDRAQRSSTREIQDLFDARAEVAQARSQGGDKSAIAKLKPDKNVAGTVMPGLSIEEAAFALHRMDMLGEAKGGVRGRGGQTAVQLRDRYLRKIEGEQRAARGRGQRVENSADQAAVIRAIPDELLDLTDMSNPRVKRVAAAVEEARRLNANAQLRSIEAGVVRPQTVQRAAERDSAIGVGGARWGQEAVVKVTRAARVKSQGLKKAIARAEAKGDRAEVKRLKAEYARHVAATKGRIAAIRRDSTTETPELTTARQRFRESDARLREASTSGKPSAVSAATRSRDQHFRHLRKMEREARGFTSPRRPELVGQRGTYVPDRAIDVRGSFTGPRPGGRFSGPDQPKRSQGRLKARGNIDLTPALVLHQHQRAMQNYTGRISRAALDELLSTAAYLDPKTGKPLTGERLRLLSQTDAERVRLVHVGNLNKALAKLDDLAEGRFLDDGTVRQVFTESLPAGARSTDYVAISKAAADVWTEAMTSSGFLRGLDKATNYWKGGLLALSPRWYVNNTFGLALQYGVMSGFDIAAMRRGNSAAMRRAMEKRSPNTIKDTMADDLTGGRDIPRMIRFGFRTNAKLEEFWRRSAYMNRVKRGLRDEAGKFRGLSEADIVRAIENMPERMAREIVSDVDFFIGNYRKFNKPEREILKRLVPFYSWVRVIARLTFALPFRSPVRAAAMSVLSTASEAGINPTDRALDYFERGAVRVAGKAVPTWGLNPWQTLAPVLAALGEESMLGALAEEGVGWVHPGLQFLTSLAFGTNNFGQDIVAPPYSAAYGQDPESFNPVTGRPSRQRMRLPIKEQFLSMALPGQVSVIRRVAAGGRRPWDTVETADVVLDYFNRLSGAPRNEVLYAPVSKRRGRTPSAANPIGTAFGIPIYNQDDEALVREAEKKLRDFYRDERKRARERKRAERG